MKKFVLIVTLMMSSPALSQDSAPPSRIFGFIPATAKYLRIYLRNKETFAPFSKHPARSARDQAHMLYHHFCRESHVKHECKKLKKELIGFFESSLNQLSQASAFSPPQNDTAYFERLNAVVSSLRIQYKNAQVQIDQELAQALFQADTENLIPINAEEYNQTVSQVFQRQIIAFLIEEFRKKYLQFSQDFPGVTLLSNTLHGRIEGGRFDLIFTDLILSTRELTLQPVHEFEESLTRPALQEELPKDQIEELASQLLVEDLKKDWDRNNHLVPHSVDSESFDFISLYSAGDMGIVRLLAQKEYQKAIWRLEQKGLKEKSNSVLLRLQNEILATDRILTTVPLGGGFTTTELIQFVDGSQGVFKPKPWSKKNKFKGFLQDIKDSMVSNYNKEIAAYRVDQLIGLGQVPFTEKRIIQGVKGSLQYYVGHATSGRMMAEIDIKHPVKPGKWQAAGGRTSLTPNIRLFDWLINNRDRNLDNYLIADDGKIILIDHSWTFLMPFFWKPNKEELKEMTPTEDIFENLRHLDQNTKFVDQQIATLLDGIQLKLLKKRIHFIVHSLEKRIENEGREAVFPKMGTQIGLEIR